MDIYNKAIPYDILNTKKFSHKKFNSSNLLTMKLGSFNKSPYYIFSIILRNTMLCDESKNKITQVLSSCHELELEIIEGSIIVSASVSDYIIGNLELSKLIKDIFKILSEYKYISQNTFFAISYDYLDELHNGYFETIDFFI